MGPEKISEIVRSCQDSGYLPDGSRSCLLCADKCPHEEMLVGVWLPDGKQVQRRLGCAPERLSKGGGRIVIYMLCPSCFDLPTRTEDVEKEILERAGVQ